MASSTPRSTDTQTIERAFDRERQALGIRTTFPDDVRRAADDVAQRDPSSAPGRTDRTDLPLVTIDPPGSRDLDQALYLERNGRGFQVWYAIADVGFWVDLGGPIEREAWLRGETMYAPDQRDPLYPPTLSEGAASLLPDAVRPAVLFGFALDERAEVVSQTVERGLVRSRAQLTYQQVLAHVEGGEHAFAGQPWAESLMLLKVFGEARLAREAERGGVSLPILAQHVQRQAAARLGYEVEYEQPSDSESWNAQVSLLTGHSAALWMLEARVGILRVLAPADPVAVQTFRRQALALGFAWPAGMPYPEFIRSIDARQPHADTLVWQARHVMRGADYVAFDGTAPPDPVHHALAMEYAHCTAPLRRLADRYVLDLLVELDASRQNVPDVARLPGGGKHPLLNPPTPGPSRQREEDDAARFRGKHPATGGSASDDERGRLPELARVMNEAETRASRLERAVVDIAEAWALKDRVGERFPAAVIGLHNGRVEVQLTSPAVRAAAERGPDPRPLELDERVEVELTGVDVEAGRVSFVVAG